MKYICPRCKAEMHVITPKESGELARLFRPSCNGYALMCPKCDILIGWDTDYGGMFQTERELQKDYYTYSTDKDIFIDVIEDLCARITEINKIGRPDFPGYLHAWEKALLSVKSAKYVIEKENHEN